MVVGSGISWQHNKETPEPIRVVGQRPILVLVSSMKRYTTDLFQTEQLKRIGRLRKDVISTEKIRLRPMDIYATISTIQLKICRLGLAILQFNGVLISFKPWQGTTMEDIIEYWG